jgi:acyl carrier protein
MATQNDLASKALSGRDMAADIKTFIFKQYPLARKKTITDSDPLLESGVLDSLGILDLVAFIEKEFLIGVLDEDLVPENFQTINRIAAFVRSKTNGEG